MSKKLQTLVILPAAGYGTRVNADPSSGKELMRDPMTEKPLIEWSITVAAAADMEPLIISRIDKTNFNEYLDKRWPAHMLVKPEVLKEWPTTVLLSKSEWHSANIMLLPDTRFDMPVALLKELERQLLTYDVVFGTMPLLDLQECNKYAILDGMYSIAEKPEPPVDERHMEIICLIAFRQLAGEALFTGLADKGKWFNMPKGQCVNTVPVTNFKDITRSGTIEEY